MITNNFFCVFVGWIPGIYTSSEEVAEQLHDYGDGGWMEFPTLDNAEEAWALFQGNGNVKKGRKMIAKGKAPAGLQPPQRRQMERIALKALHLRFEEDRRRTTPHPRPDQLVPHKPTRNPLIIVSMTRLLSKTCNKLDIPPPVYRIIQENTSTGGRNFRHLVSVVLPGESEALVVTSRVASEPHISLEDSARLCLRNMCQNLNGYVDDYNLDLVLGWKERYVDLARDMGKLQTRLQEVTRYNDSLQKMVNRANKTRQDADESAHTPTPATV
ncbi:uncharacterized protein DS421_14g457160 [Arachis hypogaea]|nr:uncharacterized protein DS421_14g457160 [Arachis hypogaea]